MTDLLRVYFDPHEIAQGGQYEGYPYAWYIGNPDEPWASLPIKDMIRERDGHRCLRCGHPYRVGEMGSGEWTPCDEHCSHPSTPTALVRWCAVDRDSPTWHESDAHGYQQIVTEQAYGLGTCVVEAQWRILTVHHLNGVKHDCRWWNLVSLCQRCHLTIQGKVRMERPWVREHSDWFKPFAAAYYAESILGEELTRAEVDARLDELLDLQPHTARML